MAPRTSPPFRADHVGSLLRPTRLVEARAKARAGQISAAAARAVEDECVREAVALQESIGLQAITDGEFRRDWWHLDFLVGFDGIELWDARRSQSFSSGEQPAITRVTGKVRHGRRIFVDQFAFLKSATSRTAKATIPGPAMVHLRPGREAIDPAVYPDIEEFWADICAAYRAEIAALAAAGCTYLQIDDVSFAYLCDEGMRRSMRQRGDDPNEVLGLYTRLINDVVRDRPSGLTVAVHMCRGNFKSSWVAQGGYEPVAETVFNRMNVDGIFLEYDSDRAGGFEPLRFVPKGKLIVLGLVTTKTPALENPSDLKRRIDEATRYVALDQLCLSPQCGFASSHHGNAVTADDQKRKLELVVRTAAEVWGGS
jgi:5-methyltetrahydropteroyltriglutamate--homocysteine methyltransferase